MKKSGVHGKAVIADNRKARYEYTLGDMYEAGIVLLGTEIKSLRRDSASIADAYAGHEDGEIWLYNVHIAEYFEAGRFNHDPRRKRKLLLHKREIRKIVGALERKGFSLIPLQIYCNDKNLVKVSLSLAKGKQKHDKREAIKAREWNRSKARVLSHQL